MATKTSLEKMYKFVHITDNKIYTYYFGGLSKIDTNNFIVVPVCRTLRPVLAESLKDTCKYYVNCKYLGPEENLLTARKYGSMSEEDFKYNYSKYLAQFHAKSVLTDIYNLAAGGQIDPMLGGWIDGCEPDPSSEAYNKDILLCCYEKPEDFCHRHILAEWFTFNGYNCEELKTI